MTRSARKAAIIFVALMVALSGAFVLQGAVAQESGDGSGDEETDGAGSLDVTSLSAPESAAPGSTIEVAAEVANPTDSRLTERVEYRIDGQLVDTELVTVEPGASAMVQFTAELEGMDAGPIYHGVFTENAGQVQQITLSESFTLDSVSAPDNAAVGDELTVEAEVSNPNDFETNQTVNFRLGGQVIDEERVTIAAGGTETVTFTAGTDGLEPGDYVHGVFTREDGQFLQLTLEEAMEEAPTEVSINETDTPTEEPVNVTETPTEVPLNETDTATEAPVNVTETPTEVPFNETETPTEEPVCETETPTEEPVNETPTEEPVNETFTEEPIVEAETPTEEPENVTDNVTGEPLNETETSTEVDDAPSASVVFPTYNATMVTVNQVTLSDGGFVAIHNESLKACNTVSSVIGVSEYLEPGTHENVEVHLFNVSGADYDQTELTESQTLIAMPHLDTNDNETYDFVATNGTADGPYLEDGDAVTDEAFVHIETEDEPVEEPETETPTEEPVNVTDDVTEEPVNETETPTEEPVNETETEVPLDETETEAPLNETEDEDADVTLNETDETDDGLNVTDNVTDGVDEPAAPANASVSFMDQTSNGTAVTVDNVTVPDGGYVAIHDQFLFEGDVIGSVVGVSGYLEAGTHENVTVHLFNVSGAEFDQTELTENQTLIAMPHQETNDNETYDFVATNGSEDGAYTVEGEPVTDEGLVTVEPAAAPDEVNETDGLNETTDVNETDGLNETENETDDVDVGAPLDETNETDGLNATENVTDGLNETEDGNETVSLNATENVTDGAEVDANASVEVTAVDEQALEMTVNASLPDGGYVAVHDESLLANATAIDEDEAVNSTIGVSEYLEPGDHENVTIDLFELSGAEFNETAANESQLLLAMPHQETNDNETFDYVATNGTEDGPYTIDGDPIVAPAFFDAPEDEPLIGFNETAGEDAEMNETDGLDETTDVNETDGLNETDDEDVGAPLNETDNETEDLNETDNETAADGGIDRVTAPTEVTFENQTANETDNGTEVTIESVTVSEGGFVAIHNESLLDGDAVGSVVGVSGYLEVGTHENVSIVLYNVTGAEFTDTGFTENQTLIAMPHQDTNDNETYDFVATNGTEDGAYVADGEAVTDNATVAPPTDSATAGDADNDSAALGAS